MVFLFFAQHCFFVGVFDGGVSLLSVLCLLFVLGIRWGGLSTQVGLLLVYVCIIHACALVSIVLPFVQHCVCCVFSKRRWRPVQCFTCQLVQSALCSSSRGRESCFLHMQRSRLVSCHSLPRTWPPCHSVSCWELGAPVSGTWRLRRCSQASPCQPPR